LEKEVDEKWGVERVVDEGKAGGNVGELER